MASIVCAPSAGARLDVVIGLSFEGCQQSYNDSRGLQPVWQSRPPRRIRRKLQARRGRQRLQQARHARERGALVLGNAPSLSSAGTCISPRRSYHPLLIARALAFATHAYRKARSGLALSRRAFFDSSPAPAGFLRSPQAPLHCPPTQQLPQPGKPRRTGIAICLFPLEDPRPWSAGLTISQAIEVSKS